MAGAARADVRGPGVTVELTVTPVFLFSLPRSGSTLVQKLLATHPEVATASEPWILLPLLYSLRRPGVFAEYGHRTTVRAIEDFCDALPAGREEYLAEVRDMALSLYQSAAGDASLFVDKTPRYHLIADDIMELFPRARFIFLWRQPLAVAASIMESFGDGRWNLEKYTVDLEDGLENLAAAQRLGDERVISVRFEDVVREPQAQLERLCGFLGIDPLQADPSTFKSISLAGRMGDRTGVKQYRTVSAEPLDKWLETMNTWYRRRWCRRYLNRIGRYRLSLMGYDYDSLMRQVESLDASPRRLGSDVSRHIYWQGRQKLANRFLEPSSRERSRLRTRTEASVHGP
jgi:hypothetical protein